MTYFDDLLPYSYSEFRSNGRKVLCIGWLDAAHGYPTGSTPRRFHAALLKLCVEDQVAQSRGFHQCDLPPCDKRAAWPPVSVNPFGGEVFLGSAEIRVTAGNDVSFAAPDLIYHYVVEHGYKPPTQFIEAVLGGLK